MTKRSETFWIEIDETPPTKEFNRAWWNNIKARLDEALEQGDHEEMEKL